jgi:hypothetical protein
MANKSIISKQDHLSLSRLFVQLVGKRNFVASGGHENFRSSVLGISVQRVAKTGMVHS